MRGRTVQSMRRFLSILSALLLGFIAPPLFAQRPSRAEAEAEQAGTKLPLLRIDAQEPIVSDRKVPCAAQLILPPPATGEAVDVEASVPSGLERGQHKFFRLRLLLWSIQL